MPGHLPVALYRTRCQRYFSSWPVPVDVAIAVDDAVDDAFAAHDADCVADSLTAWLHLVQGLQYWFRLASDFQHGTVPLGA